MDEKRFDELAMMVAEETTPGDEGITPADESMPRRAALGVVSGLAGLAALAASASSASAQAGQTGLLTRIRRITDSVDVPNNSNQYLRLVCPTPGRDERALVVGGGYSHSTNNPSFVIKTNGPDTIRSWIIDGHNVNTGGRVSLSGVAICAYFRK